jgi:enoyl-CoA hydratase/carnithine racemase
MTDYETLRFSSADGLATITLARPDKRNAMSREMFVELGDAVEQVSGDATVRGLLLAAEGPSFCAGIDLGALAGLAGVRGAPFQAFLVLAQRPFRLLARSPKPSVAAVRGHALGAGFQLALACDLRVVAEDVKMGLLEARYGLIPDLGGMHHLARLAGPAVAKELTWTARTVEANEAQRLGLANRVVGPENLEKEAETLLREVTAHSPIATALAKSLIDRAAETPLETELEREGQAQAATLASEDHAEAVAAFLERRPPKFTGR